MKKTNLVSLVILIIIALMFPVRAISSDVVLGLLQEQAKKGNAEAQEELGRCFYYGHKVEKDHHQAAEWFRKAAEQGNMKAQYSLGI